MKYGQEAAVWKVDASRHQYVPPLGTLTKGELETLERIRHETHMTGAQLMEAYQHHKVGAKEAEPVPVVNLPPEGYDTIDDYQEAIIHHLRKPYQSYYVANVLCVFPSPPLTEHTPAWMCPSTLDR